MLTFPEFALLWQRWQGQTTPAVHRNLIAWFADEIEHKEQRLLLLAFRNCGKSTILGVLCAWLLYRDPNHRILVLAAEQALATKLSRYARKVIETHPFCQALRAKTAAGWADDAFTVNRSATWRDPSLLARGIGANITGAHADTVICDDVEVPNTAATASRRAWLRERLAEIEHIVSPDGLQIYAGTPHTYYSIYAHHARPEVGEDAPILAGFRRKVLPIRTPEGTSVWPERFPIDVIEDMEKRVGARVFASQMLLQPTAPGAARLDPEHLRCYDAEVELHERNGTMVLSIDGSRMQAASAWWDPAFGAGKGDHSVVAVVFIDEAGHYFLHCVEYLKVDVNDAADPATQQCRQVAKVLQRLSLPSLTVETNGIGAFLPGLLRQTLSELRVSAAVQAASARQNKDERILSAIEVPLAAGCLNVHRSVYGGPFVQEMREWRPGGGGHDDGLDAVAGAISQSPVRLRATAPIGERPAWRGGGQIQAQVDFTP